MRLFGRIAAADLEALNLRLFFNQATAAIDGLWHTIKTLCENRLLPFCVAK